MSPSLIDTSAAVARLATFMMLTGFVTFGIVV